jgi:hypothetical protein
LGEIVNGARLPKKFTWRNCTGRGCANHDALREQAQRVLTSTKASYDADVLKLSRGSSQTPTPQIDKEIAEPIKAVERELAVQKAKEAAKQKKQSQSASKKRKFEDDSDSKEEDPAVKASHYIQQVRRGHCHALAGLS